MTSWKGNFKLTKKNAIYSLYSHLAVAYVPRHILATDTVCPQRSLTSPWNEFPHTQLALFSAKNVGFSLLKIPLLTFHSLVTNLHCLLSKTSSLWRYLQNDHLGIISSNHHHQIVKKNVLFFVCFWLEEGLNLISIFEESMLKIYLFRQMLQINSARCAFF